MRSSTSLATKVAIGGRVPTKKRTTTPAKAWIANRDFSSSLVISLATEASGCGGCRGGGRRRKRNRAGMFLIPLRFRALGFVRRCGFGDLLLLIEESRFAALFFNEAEFVEGPVVVAGVAGGVAIEERQGGALVGQLVEGEGGACAVADFTEFLGDFAVHAVHCGVEGVVCIPQQRRS